MYKCSHCNIEIPDNQAEGRIVKVGPKDNPKCYCMECGEPVVYIPDMPQTTGGIHGAQATLISNSDNRITTNNYYGSGTPDVQIETPYGPCLKSEARLCKKCRQWVPVSFFNEEKKLCDDCVKKEVQKYVEDGKSYFDIGFYNDAIRCFQNCELICSDENELLNLKSLIGRSYYELKDYSQALKYFIAASRNNSESVYYIGISYLNGTGVAKDEGKALELLKKSANMGYQKAIDFLLERQRLEERRKMLETMELHLIKENGKFGFADENGNIVIPCKWRWAGGFHEGLAMVEADNQKYGFIEKTGNVVIPCKWKFTNYFSEGLTYVEDDNKKWGFIDKTGRMIIPCKWKGAGSFREGLAPVRDDNDKWGFIDKRGEVVIPCKWKYAGWVYEGLASVRDDNDKWGYIDKTGKIVISCKWKEAGNFHEGFAYVQDDNDKYGFIDKAGRIIIPCKWKGAGSFGEGLAPVRDDNDKWGFIDKRGETVIPFKWKEAYEFGLNVIGKAYVQNEDGNWVDINKKGEVIQK